jgi:hypothetical protein
MRRLDVAAWEGFKIVVRVRGCPKARCASRETGDFQAETLTLAPRTLASTTDVERPVTGLRAGRALPRISMQDGPTDRQLVLLRENQMPDCRGEAVDDQLPPAGSHVLGRRFKGRFIPSQAARKIRFLVSAPLPSVGRAIQKGEL